LGLCALLFAAAPRPAQAQGLIRDAEIERTLGMIANPVLRAAGLSPKRVNIYIINDRRLNAFVAGGDNIFLHTGLLQRLETIDQVRAVIAHEAGHLAGGHQGLRGAHLRRAQGTAALGMILAAAAAAAGAPPEIGIAAGVTGGQVAERILLAHSRAEESAADHAALTYLAAAGSDPRAMLEVMDIFQGQEILSSRHSDPYVRTHPLWTERIRHMRDRALNMARGTAPGAADRHWHRRMVAKFDAFLLPPDRVLRDYAGNTEYDVLARAIALHRRPAPAKARAAMDALLKARPDDAFHHELNGQFLLESGNAQAAAQAYRRAAALAPDQPLILSGLGRALIAIDTSAATREALEVLTRARKSDKADATALRNLAIAHARLGNPGQASLATAERMMLSGRPADAAIHAGRAQKQLSAGSPGWRQADDILRAARRAADD